MSNDREIRESLYKTDTVYLYLAIRRHKENKNIKGPEKIFRVVIRDEKEDLIGLMVKCKLFPGIWRIYKTVNPRNCKKAQIMLLHKLIDEPDKWCYRIDSLWKTMLLQPECKMGKHFMVDVDLKEPELISKLVIEIIKSGGDILLTQESPNGFHLIVNKLDTRVINKEKYPNVDVIRDGYVFIDRIVVEENKNEKK